jgi:hypothetical protein
LHCTAAKLELDARAHFEAARLLPRGADAERARQAVRAGLLARIDEQLAGVRVGDGAGAGVAVDADRRLAAAEPRRAPVR